MRIKKRSFIGLLNNNNFVGYTFIFPWIMGFLLFMAIPMIISIFMSFRDYNLIGDMFKYSKFVGLKNYIWLFFKDEKFYASIRVTFFFVLTAVPLRLSFALLVALILNKRGVKTGVYKTIYYLPSIIGSSVAIAIVWREMFGTNGIINKIAYMFGYENTMFTLINNIHTAIWVVILLYVWEFGSSMLIFLAGIQNIPDTYYEAAVVEGVGFWKKLFHITLPLLSPIILFNLIMQTIHGFLVFTQVYIISNGQGSPLKRTLVYALYMYQRAFMYSDMGAASAMAWIMLVIIAGVTGLIFFTSKFWVFYESKEGI